MGLTSTVVLVTAASTDLSLHLSASGVTEACQLGGGGRGASGSGIIPIFDLDLLQQFLMEGTLRSHSESLYNPDQP